MASFFDKVVIGINKGVNSVSESSKLIIEKANVNTSIKDAEKEKSILLQNLGTLIYNLHISQEITIEQCAGICGEIAMIDQKIMALQQQLQALEANKAQVVQTPQYMQSSQHTQTSVIQQTPQVQFEPQQETIETQNENKNICVCGFTNKPEAKFCAACGAKLEV